jgi:DNA polymerase III subunit epsilon
MNFIELARIEAHEKAKIWLWSDFVIVDTETTGLYNADAIEISVIDHNGTTLFDSRIQTAKTIEAKAEAVHGISAKSLDTAPTFEAVYDRLAEILKGRLVLIYNAGFDLPILDRMSEAIGKPTISTIIKDFDCVMECYAAFVGEWNDYHGNFRWQRLPSGDHSALGDCLATLEVIKRMAK